MHGFGRKIHPEFIYEGYFFEGNYKGFGRGIWGNGSYYIGMWKDNFFNGEGKRICSNGN
jgi:hypothetical protein